jgi:hypothetical protein
MTQAHFAPLSEVKFYNTDAGSKAEKSSLGCVFIIRLGCFPTKNNNFLAQMRPLLELKRKKNRSKDKNHRQGILTEREGSVQLISLHRPVLSFLA